MDIECETCGKVFNKPKSHAVRVKHHYCSKECHDQAQRSGSALVRCVVCGSEFSVSPSNRHRYSTCGKECQKRHRAMEGNPNWKGGKTTGRNLAMSLSSYKRWRNKVLERDRCCVECGSTSDLQVDHIKSWAGHPDLRYETSNGRVLCGDCHKLTYKDNAKERRLLSDVDVENIIRSYYQERARAEDIATAYGCSVAMINRVCSFTDYRDVSCRLLGDIPLDGLSERKVVHIYPNTGRPVSEMTTLEIVQAFSAYCQSILGQAGFTFDISVKGSSLVGNAGGHTLKITDRLIMDPKVYCLKMLRALRNDDKALDRP